MLSRREESQVVLLTERENARSFFVGKRSKRRHVNEGKRGTEGYFFRRVLGESDGFVYKENGKRNT